MPSESVKRHPRLKGYPRVRLNDTKREALARLYAGHYRLPAQERAEVLAHAQCLEAVLREVPDIPRSDMEVLERWQGLRTHDGFLVGPHYFYLTPRDPRRPAPRARHLGAPDQATAHVRLPASCTFKPSPELKQLVGQWAATVSDHDAARLTVRRAVWTKLRRARWLDEVIELFPKALTKEVLVALEVAPEPTDKELAEVLDQAVLE